MFLFSPIGHDLRKNALIKGGLMEINNQRTRLYETNNHKTRKLEPIQQKLKRKVGLVFETF